MAFLQAVEPISHYCLSGQHSYTRVPLADTNVLSSESSDFKYHVDSQSFWLLTVVLSGITPYYVTTTAFQTLPNYYKFKNAQWSDQYSVRKINTDIHLMCELHVTVKLYRSKCS